MSTGCFMFSYYTPEQHTELQHKQNTPTFGCNLQKAWQIGFL